MFNKKEIENLRKDIEGLKKDFHDIKIGSNSIIGAGSVVVKEVDPNSIYCGVPAQKIKTRE